MISKSCKIWLFVLLVCVSFSAAAQKKYEMKNGWKCKNATDINKSGQEISRPDFLLTGWLPAVVPGTVLTTLLHAHLAPDPFYGMNLKKIPDIYATGRDH